MYNLCNKKILVLATMSAGKSTLLNALIGEDILPSSNEACTAKVIRYMGNDMTSMISSENLAEPIYKENLIQLNQNSEVFEVNLTGPIKSHLLNGMTVQYIDTPGVNNSQDESHGTLTYHVLETGDFDVILYVLNATQLGITDDALLLSKLKTYLRNNSKKKVIFVLNKIDQLDFERESMEEILQNSVQYIKKSTGIKDPCVIGVSAFYAILVRKQMNKQLMTRKERMELSNFISDVDEYGLSYERCHSIKELKSDNKLCDELLYLHKTGLINLEKLLYTSSETEIDVKELKLRTKMNAKSKRVEIGVLSATKAGKSMLINAFAGCEVIPNYLDVNETPLFKLQHVRNQKEVFVEAYDKNQRKLRAARLENYDFTLKDDRNPQSIIFKYHLPAFTSSSSKVSFTEIPSEYVQDTLIKEMIQFGFILYMIDSSHTITDDDEKVLSHIKEIIERQGFNVNEKIIFVLNKIDCLDFESLQLVLDTCSSKLIKIGYKDAILYPVSSQIACLIRRLQNGEELTGREKRILLIELEMLEKNSMYSDFINPEMIRQHLKQLKKVNSNNSFLSELRLAIHYTGIPILESLIKEKLR